MYEFSDTEADNGLVVADGLLNQARRWGEVRRLIPCIANEGITDSKPARQTSVKKRLMSRANLDPILEDVEL